MLRFSHLMVKKSLLILPLAILTCYSAYCLVYANLFAQNTLVNDGEWISTKEQLAPRGVMGAYSFMRRTQALAGGRLNLDAWHGFQEVVTKEKMRLTQAEFDFRLDPDAYFCFEFKLPEHFCGIRISLNPEVKSIYFEANEDGEFTAQHEITMPPFPAKRWNHFTLSRTDAGAEVRINGRPAGVGAVNIPECCSPAFRGGQKPAAVDNVAFRTPQFTILEDAFLYKHHFPLRLFYALVILLLIDYAYYYSQHIHKDLPSSFYRSFLVFHGIMALIATFVLSVVYATAGWYPIGGELTHDETRYLYNLWDWRKDEVFQRGMSNQDATRVLFLGSSQTFGAGVRTEQETYVSVIERRLNESAANSPGFCCINAGINGNRAQGLAKFYEESWITTKPAVTVVDLGVNDHRWSTREEFESGLRRIATLNRERNIRTLFVNEARTWELPAGDPDDDRAFTSEEVMKKVAAEFGIAYVDARVQLNASRDRGFQWWDFVHPTSFGHRLIADVILEELKKMPEIKAHMNSPTRNDENL